MEEKRGRKEKVCVELTSDLAEYGEEESAESTSVRVCVCVCSGGLVCVCACVSWPACVLISMWVV